MSEISATDRDNIDYSLCRALDYLFLACHNNNVDSKKFKKVFKSIQQARQKVEKLHTNKMKREQLERKMRKVKPSKKIGDMGEK